jgi:hypothetical protein
MQLEKEAEVEMIKEFLQPVNGEETSRQMLSR